ncbi:hypothetical protein [Compostimonas suwonensis]|uniref:Uncharacterized protein n=1 Tax=Compostimonas suwonensis TaxID=1048394 RepID=A0A2M9C399_9MICO|nr:hypothetical protein [Compostimonas suwonensis]PJJ65021.1 hypothetical protein CLV54_0046 [Compostimonas suwonensis]
MRQLLDVSAWVWRAPTAPTELNELDQHAASMGFRSHRIGDDSTGTAYIVRIISAESATPVYAHTPTVAHSVITESVVSSGVAPLRDNLATAVTRFLSARDSASGHSNDILIDSAQVVVRRASAREALQAAFRHVTTQRAAMLDEPLPITSDVEWVEESPRLELVAS